MITLFIDTSTEYLTVALIKDDIILKETKISALINHHLYIYTYGSSNNKVDYLLIDDLKNSDDKTYYSFNVEIKNFTVTILFIKSFFFFFFNLIYTL